MKTLKTMFARLMILALVLTQGGGIITGTTYAAGVCDASDVATLQTALADTTCSEVTLLNDITSTEFPRLSIDRPLTLNGNGNTLNVNISTATYANHADGIVINADGVTIKNIILNNLSSLTDNNKGYGINVFQSNGAALDNITVSNFNKGGINVNNSEATLIGTITLTNNAWGGIDVSKGTPSSTLNINGAAINFSGNGFVIWSDDSTAVVNNPATYSEFTYAAGKRAYVDASCVANQTQLIAAVASTATDITLCADIALTNKITINRDLTIKGNNKSITLATSSWSGIADQNGQFASNGNFIFKIIDGANVSLESIIFDGGAAAIQAYGNSVVTTKDITIKNSKFGGISVNTDTNGSLIIDGTLTYDNTNTTNAVIWLDTRDSHDDANVAGYAAAGLTPIINPAKTTELWYVKTTACVTNQSELEAAVANPFISTITLCADFTLTSKVNITRNDIIIDGSGHTLTFNDAASWDSAYFFQAYNVSNIVFKNITFDGGDAAFLINNSTATAENIVINNPEFGGIEVSNGSASLTLEGSFSYNGSNTLPALWIDGKTTNDGFVVNNSNVTFSEVIKPTQLWFTQTSACVTNQSELEAAVANTSISAITLCNDFEITAKVNITRNNVTIDGSGHTLTFNSAAGWQGAYFFQAYKATDIAFKNITFSGGDAVLNVNGSEVSIENLTINGVEFGGIEVSQGTSVTEIPKLTIIAPLTYTGATEAVIWIDKKTTNDGWVVNYTGVSLAEKIMTGKNQLWFVPADIIAPVVTLIGSGTITIKQGTVFTDLGATWTDNVDGTGSITIATSGSVNTGVVGTYTLTYSYTDVAGNTGNVVTRTIKVEANTSSSGSSGGGSRGGGSSSSNTNNPSTSVVLSGEVGSGDLFDLDDTTSNTDTCSITNSPYTDEQNRGYVYACTHDITTMRTVQTARINDYVTRAEFAKMISNYAINILDKEVPTTYSDECTAYSDLGQTSSELAGFAVTSCKLGIMGLNMGGVFRPSDLITRAEVATILSRLYGWAEDTSPFYTNHMKAMVDKGFITINNPTLNEVRGNIFIMLDRIDQATSN